MFVSERALAHAASRVISIQKNVALSSRRMFVIDPASRAPINKKRYLDSSDNPLENVSAQTLDLKSMVNAKVKASDIPLEVDLAKKQASASRTQRLIEKPLIRTTVEDVIPKLPEGSYQKHSERKLSEREKLDKKSKMTENILIAAFVISLVIGLFTLKPDYGKMKVQLAKESSDLPEYMTEHISTGHIVEAFEHGIGQFGTTKTLLDQLLTDKPLNTQFSTAEIISLLQNAGIEFQAAMQVLNAVYKLNVERSTPEFETSDAELQSESFSQLAELSQSLQSSLLYPRHANEPSPLRSVGIIIRAHLEDLFAKCLLNPSVEAVEEYESFVLALKEHGHHRVYPNQDYAKGYRAVLKDTAEHTFDGSSIKSFVASEGAWKYLHEIEFLLPLLADTCKIAKKNKVLTDAELMAESPDVFDGPVLSVRSRLESRYLFPTTQTGILTSNLLGCIQSSMRFLAQDELRRRQEEKDGELNEDKKQEAAVELPSASTSASAPVPPSSNGWFSWIWGNPASSSNLIEISRVVSRPVFSRGELYPALPFDPTRPVPGAIPGDASYASDPFATTYPVPATSPFSARFSKRERFPELENFLLSASTEDVAKVRDSLKSLQQKLTAVQKGQFCDLSSAYRLMVAYALVHDPQYKKDLKNFPSGTPFTESVHKYVMPSARVPHLEKEYLVPVIPGEKFNLLDANANVN